MLKMCPRPAARGDHLGRDDARDVEKPLDVGVDHGVPVARVALVDVLQSGGETRVVDQQVDVFERREVAAHLLLGAHVEGERRAAAARRFDLRAQRREPVGPAARGDDGVSLLCQPERRGASDARSGSRNQCLFLHTKNVCFPQRYKKVGWLQNRIAGAFVKPSG